MAGLAYQGFEFASHRIARTDTLSNFGRIIILPLACIGERNRKPYRGQASHDD
jgi:hypothetical protein